MTLVSTACKQRTAPAAIGCQLTNLNTYTAPDSFTYDTTIGWDSEPWKQGVTHDPVTNNSQITIVTPGKYIVECMVQIAAFNPTGGMGVQLFINGAGSAFSQVNNQGSSGNNYQPLFGFSSIKNLSAGDVLTVKVAQKSGGVQTYAATGSDFYCCWVGT